MKLGPCDNCRSCDEPIMVGQVRGGKWIPFNLQTIEAGPEAVDAFLPISSPGVVVFVPIADVPPRHLEYVRWYAQRHRCAAYFHALAAKRQERTEQREHVDSLAEAIEEFFAPAAEDAS